MRATSRVVAQSALILCVGAILVWAVATPIPVLRQQLMRLQFWSLEVCVAIGVPLTAVVLRQITQIVRRRDFFGIACAMGLGLSLTLGVAPRTARIFYDEQIYQNIGQNLADLKLAQMCNDGEISGGRLNCIRGEYNKQPYAYPHLLSLVYRVSGVDSTAAYAVNAVAMAVTIGLVYLAVLVIFDDSSAAFCAAVLLALMPEQVVWSASGAVEPTASAACVASILAAGWFVRSRSTAALAGTAVATAYAIQFRPESLLIVPVIGVLIWQRAPEELNRSRLWWAAVLFVALTAVHLGHMAAVRNDGWGTSQSRLSLGYALQNIRANGPFYFADRRFPALYTILAITGVAWPREARGRLTLACYFACFFLLPLFFYAGSFDYGADVRYSLATYPPIAMLGGLGLVRLARLARHTPGRLAVTLSLAMILGAQFVYCLPVIRSTTDSAWAARADVEFARAARTSIPRDAYVLTQNPGMFQVWGLSAGQLSLAANDPSHLASLFARYRGGIYLHWSFWCNVQDQVQRRFCTTVLDSSRAELVREDLVRDQRFAFYKLIPQMMSGNER